MSEKVVYVGKDLEAMSFAVNYHNWILEEFRPFLGKHIVEVGAGTGSFSELLLKDKPETLSLVEPSEMFKYLEQNLSQFTNGTKTNFYQAIFTEVCDTIAEQKKPDSVIYVNVMEHVEDDAAELRAIYKTLENGGRCFIFVPALMALYGEFDRKIGHFRRYTKKEIEDKCAAAGFKVIKSKYFDFTGILPWYVKYKVLKSDSLESGAVTAYDKFVVPFISRFESYFNFPVGKNVLIIAEKRV